LQFGQCRMHQASRPTCRMPRPSVAGSNSSSCGTAHNEMECPCSCMPQRLESASHRLTCSRPANRVMTLHVLVTWRRHAALLSLLCQSTQVPAQHLRSCLIWLFHRCSDRPSPRFGRQSSRLQQQLPSAAIALAAGQSVLLTFRSPQTSADIVAEDQRRRDSPLPPGARRRRRRRRRPGHRQAAPSAPTIQTCISTVLSSPAAAHPDGCRHCTSPQL
jgi:hypothetical protein